MLQFPLFGNRKRMRVSEVSASFMFGMSFISKLLRKLTYYVLFIHFSSAEFI